MTRIAGWTLAALIVTAGCTEKKVPRINGTRLLSGQAEQVYVSPTGEFVASILDSAPSPDPGAPPDIFLGDLTVVPVKGGKAYRVGRGVPTLPGKVLYSNDGVYLACEADFSVAHDLGELRLAKIAAGQVEHVADDVSFFAFSPAGDRLAYISDRQLFLRPTAGGQATQIASEVSLFEIGPQGKRILIHKEARTGGELDLYDVDTGKLTRLAHGASNFGFSHTGDAFAFRAEGLLAPGILRPGAKPVHGTKDEAGFYRVVGHGPPERLSTDHIPDFKFSPDGLHLAWVTPASIVSPAGDLYVASGDDVKLVEPHVTRFEYTPDGTLYFIGQYDAGADDGTLGYLARSGQVVKVADRVKTFRITPKAHYVLFSQLEQTQNYLTLVLDVHRIGAPPTEKPRRIDLGVFGYVTDRDEKYLAYKARCTDNGKSCDLFVTDLAHPAPAVLIAQHVAAFDFSPISSDVVVATSRADGELTGRLLYSLGLVAPQANAQARTLEDRMLGDFTVAGVHHDRAVYLVGEKGREGLYVTDLRVSAGQQTTPPKK